MPSLLSIPARTRVLEGFYGLTERYLPGWSLGAGLFSTESSYTSVWGHHTSGQEQPSLDATEVYRCLYSP